MNYNFDEIIDRSCTYDMKWHGRAVSSYLGLPIPEDMIPMWLADTEFACPPVIVDAIKERAAKRIYGYCTPMEDYYQAICRWQERRFGWEISPDWILPIPSVVAGINIAIRAFTTAQDGVIIQQPVYDPFEAIVRRTGRTLVVNQLLEKDGRFEMNWDELERLAADPRNTMMILCSPHNPVGRVWTQEELKRVIDICSRNNVMPVSDEIHSDIVFSGHKHTPLLSLDAQTAGRAVLLSAPSKTFNVAGLKMSHAIIPGKSTRDAFLKAQTAYSLDIKNTFGIESTVAAYTPQGEEWLEQLLVYLEGNVQAAEDFLAGRLPKARLVRPEGTFLCWLDLSDFGFTDEELLQKIILQSGVICVPGPWFGRGGEGHMRLNIGCPRKMLLAALERIAAAIS